MANVLGIDPYAFLRDARGDEVSQVSQTVATVAAACDTSGASAADEGSAAKSMACPRTDGSKSMQSAEVSQLSQLSQGVGAEAEKPASPLAHADEHPERSALASSLAGPVPDEWREGFARLQCMTPPAAVSEARWWQVLNDAGVFIDRWGPQAAALGWGAADVFGVDGKAPEHRLEFAGLVWLVQGRPVVAITAEAATINVRQGVTQRYFRRMRPGGVLLWELEKSA